MHPAQAYALYVEYMTGSTVTLQQMIDALSDTAKHYDVKGSDLLREMQIKYAGTHKSNTLSLRPLEYV